jgi:hypothetical protein
VPLLLVKGGLLTRHAVSVTGWARAVTITISREGSLICQDTNTPGFPEDCTAPDLVSLVMRQVRLLVG